ncbi:hypothetical protein F2Q69_00052886 [Brassica cretica]|uniref:Uncharacterized protein n=1 Tax=Brassica cretica TaxID=69181 RepID=A0A8S9N803_BRACR|nr:hypothetical protein F2Q69_00052886 [Brassica cretica]
MVSIDARPRPSIDIQQSKSIDRNSIASIDDAYGVNHVLQHREDSNSRGVRSKTPTSAQPYYSPEPVRTPLDDGKDPMEEDRVPTGRTLRRRKEKVAKHLKRGANDKEKEKTRDKEEDIRRMFSEARDKMRMMITLKKKSDPGQFAIPCTVEPSQELFTFVDCSQRNSGGIVRDLEVQIVVKEEKLQEGYFEVESLMSFGGSQWCRSTPDLDHRSTYTSPNRSRGTPEHRSMTPTESTASCNAVKILTHEEFAAKHPHPPSPVNVRIDLHGNNNIDRHSEAAINRQPPASID